MARSTAANAGTSHSSIPVSVSEQAFERFVLPCLSMPKRGPKCKIGYWRLFNYVLKVEYTGMQWKELPIAPGPDGKPEIHYTVVYKRFARVVRGRLYLQVLRGVCEAPSRRR